MNQTPLSATMKQINVIKRDGRREPLDLEKSNRVLMWACEGVANVSASEIAMVAVPRLHNDIKTTELHKSFINAAEELIHVDHHYAEVMSRLLLIDLLKRVYGDWDKITPLYNIVRDGCANGLYYAELVDEYTRDEWDTMNSWIDHRRDFKYKGAGMKQMIDKYLVQNRATGEIFETPQVAYMLCAAAGFARYPKAERMSLVHRHYNQTSRGRVSLPTPVFAGVRQLDRQYASCILVDVGDSLRSITTAENIATHYAAHRAGLGINVGRIRPALAKVRNGDTVSTGVVPYLKAFESTIKSCSQGGVRDASATTFLPVWHTEVFDVLALKSVKTEEAKAVRRLDYCLQWDSYLMRRAVQRKPITLFAPNEVPDLYEAFFGKDRAKFEALYEKYEQDTSLSFRKQVDGRELYERFLVEAQETGRYYCMMADHVNTHSPFLDPIYMSNLCVAPETRVLTKEGWKRIDELANYSFDGADHTIWNGEQWSLSHVAKTNERDSLIRITFSDGESLQCTKYHKFYVQDGYARSDRPNNKIVEKCAGALQPGDKLEKWELPILSPKKESFDSLGLAYSAGFYMGDGTIDLSYSWIYPPKYEVTSRLVGSISDENAGRKTWKHPEFSKSFVPLNDSIDMKLAWLAGYLDADGSVTQSTNCNNLQLSSVNRQVLMRVKHMLMTLGVSSKVTESRAEGYYALPDGQGGTSDYKCQQGYRLLVSSSGVEHLLSLGLDCARLKFQTQEAKRDATRFVQVVAIEDEGRFDETYCVNEPLRHKAMFNGVVTGNCVEVVLPTQPVDDVPTSIDTRHSTIEHQGLVQLCILSAINLGDINLDDQSDMEARMESAVFFLNELIDNMDYTSPQSRAATELFRPLGIGVINYAYFLAKRGLVYGEQAALDLTHRLVEQMYYYALKASCKYARVRNKRIPGWDRTIYSQGRTLLDTYNRRVDELTTEPLHCDWDSLKAAIAEHGLANATLLAFMPSESSSTVTNATSGIEPIRSLVTIKGNRRKKLTQAAPDPVRLKNAYDMLWDMTPSRMDGYIKTVAVFQKLTCQSISANLSYNPDHTGGKVALHDIMNHTQLAAKYGCKTRYYINTKGEDGEEQENSSAVAVVEATQSDEEDLDGGCAGGACRI